ncbi:hypothetical protein AAC387_Pa10g0133 [Persea americana]
MFESNISGSLFQGYQSNLTPKIISLSLTKLLFQGLQLAQAFQVASLVKTLNWQDTRCTHPAEGMVVRCRCSRFSFWCTAGSLLLLESQLFKRFLNG